MKHIRLFEEYSEKKKTIVILGLPGSGKTYLAKKIQRENPEISYSIYDDFQLNQALKNIGKENQIIADGAIIERPVLINQIKRIADDSGTELDIIYFENDPDKAYANVERRKDSGEAKPYQRFITPEDVRNYSYLYKGALPKNAKTVPIWTGD